MNALEYFLQLTDRAGQPILIKGGEVRAVSYETHETGHGPGRVHVQKFTRIDLIEGCWYLVKEDVEEIKRQLEGMELDD